MFIEVQEVLLSAPAGAPGAELFEELAGAKLEGPGEFFDRRNLRVAFARLDPAYLGRMNAAASATCSCVSPRFFRAALRFAPRLPTDQIVGVSAYPTP